MTLHLDEGALRDRLAPQLEEPGIRTGLANLVGDEFFLAFFLVSVSQGEGLGEKAVGMIGHEELADRLRGLARQEEEERGHKEISLTVARELFPAQFEGGRYRLEHALDGLPYYVAVLEANRARLESRGRRSRLNLYLTTTFGYEVMVVLLYGAVARALADSPLSARIRERVGAALDRILAEEETHLGVIEQHAALLETPREGLSPSARALLDSLECLEEDDYVYAAELAVDQVASMMRRYAEPDALREQLLASTWRET